MQIENEVYLDYSDVLIKPKRSTMTSRSEVVLSRTYNFKHSKKTWTGVPIIAANMDCVGTVSMAKALEKHEMLTCLSKYVEPNNGELRKDMFANSYGITDIGTLLVKFTRSPSDFICLDVANGYTEAFVKFVFDVRAVLRDTTIIAGNVATPEMTEALILAGADIVKIGIGPGAACLTRRVTGVGVSQLSAVISCADAAHGLGGHIIADGGCVYTGDICKAFGAGADFVMLGSMLAGFDESGGETTFDEDGNIVKSFYGMSSDTAMSLRGGKAAYRASEGRSLYVPVKGPIEPFLNEIEGGLRSACTYVGASKLKDLPKRTTFIKVSRQLNTSLEP
jgi:GMP reductase